MGVCSGLGFFYPSSIDLYVVLYHMVLNEMQAVQSTCDQNPTKQRKEQKAFFGIGY